MGLARHHTESFTSEFEKVILIGFAILCVITVVVITYFAITSPYY